MQEDGKGEAGAGLAWTPLHDLHISLGARMVAFAGYEMPVQYPPGILKEHLYTRMHAGLFDVSHMGQFILADTGGGCGKAAAALERLVPADIAGLKPGRQRYTFFTNAAGGIADDLMVANLGDSLLLIVNAATKDGDWSLLNEYLPDAVKLERTDRALLALQGPQSETALARLAPECRKMRFLDVKNLSVLDADCVVSRSGYTGEDGYEISVPADHAVRLAKALIAMDEVEPIGLGARDSLRLEAGLCLYGSDLDDRTTPVEADLSWAIPPIRREGEHAGGFPGDEIILQQLTEGVSRVRVGLRPTGRAPVRGGAELFDAQDGGEAVGVVTSGGFGPTVGGPVAMGYVKRNLAMQGTELFAQVRGKRLAVVVEQLPFVAHRYKRS